MLYIPFEVAETLGLKDGDETDFFRFNDRSFLFAKKADITNLIVGTRKEPQQERETTIRVEGARPEAPRRTGSELTSDEVAVLKKLDTLRYNQRTPESADKMMNDREKAVLQQLLKRKAVVLFSKNGTQLYSIGKEVYDKYLMRKGKEQQAKAVTVPVFAPGKPFVAGKEQLPQVENENVKLLREQGFIVLQSEAEAAGLSLSLEDSIRRGLIVGTRAFNKKFYIVLRSFVDQNSTRIIKELKEGDKRVSDIAKATGIDEDGARAILYLLAESGDVSERRRDVFALA